MRSRHMHTRDNNFHSNVHFPSRFVMLVKHSINFPLFRTRKMKFQKAHWRNDNNKLMSFKVRAASCVFCWCPQRLSQQPANDHTAKATYFEVSFFLHGCPPRTNIFTKRYLLFFFFACSIWKLCFSINNLSASNRRRFRQFWISAPVCWVGGS